MRVLIVPRAHTAIFDARFQIEMYELFHRTFGSRLGHMLGTPTILLGVLFGLHSLTGSVWLGALLLGAIVALGARIDVLAAGITAALGAALLGVAGWAAEAAFGSRTLVCIGLIACGCAIQTFSHLFEEVPPPHSGTPRFEPMGTWLRRIGLREAVSSTLLTVGVFYWLELWAAPRIWAIQVLHVLMSAGYKPGLRAALDQRTREILAHPTSDWRRPRALGSAS